MVATDTTEAVKALRLRQKRLFPNIRPQGVMHIATIDEYGIGLSWQETCVQSKGGSYDTHSIGPWQLLKTGEWQYQQWWYRCDATTDAKTTTPATTTTTTTDNAAPTTCAPTTTPAVAPPPPSPATSWYDQSCQLPILTACTA